MGKKIQAIFSDAGGILFDDTFAKRREYEFLQQHCSMSYQEFSQAFYPFKRKAQVTPGYAKRDAFRDFLCSIDSSHLYEPYLQFCKEYHTKYFEDPQHLLFSNVPGTLEKMQQSQLPFIVLTDTASTREECEDFYRRLGISSSLTDIFSSADLLVKKPDSRFFDAVLKKYPFKKEDVLFVGHDWDELYGAHSYGFQVAAINWKADREKELQALENVHLLKSFPDLLSLME